MMISRLGKTISIVLASLLATACVDNIGDRTGAEIQVVPVTYALNIAVKKNKQDEAWKELDQFVEEHWDKVSRQKVSFIWYTESGRKLANQYHDHLLKKGLNRQQLEMQQATASDNISFDLQFKTVINRVVVEVCEYQRIGSYDSENMGCYSEGARWQSMVNPEKMISTH